MTSVSIHADPAPPLPVDDTIEPFRIDGAAAVQTVLSELITAQAPVGLYLPDAERPLVEASVTSVDLQQITFALSDPSVARADLLVGAQRLLASSAPGSVRYQFPLRQIRPALSGTSGRSAPAGRLTAPLPDHVYRIQRRQAFRVTPPASDEATAHFRRPGSETELTLGIADLSATGLAIDMPASMPAPLVGEIWTGARLETRDQPPIPCTLAVMRVARGESPGTARVSCEFVSMPPEIARRIQVYVLSIERRENNRLMRLSD